MTSTEHWWIQRTAPSRASEPNQGREKITHNKEKGIIALFLKAAPFPGNFVCTNKECTQKGKEVGILRNIHPLVQKLPMDISMSQYNWRVFIGLTPRLRFASGAAEVGVRVNWHAVCPRTKLHSVIKAMVFASMSFQLIECNQRKWGRGQEEHSSQSQRLLLTPCFKPRHLFSLCTC